MCAKRTQRPEENMVGLRCSTALVEVPLDARPGEVFRLPVASSGKSLPIACPSDAGPGDVLEIRLPSRKDFLEQLNQAEKRDSSSKPTSRRQLEEASPQYGWRVRSGPASCTSSSPYMTEQQQAQASMSMAHREALLRQQQREQREQLEHATHVVSGGAAAVERAGRASAPVLAARPLAAQRSLMASIERQPPPPPPPQKQPQQQAAAARVSTTSRGSSWPQASGRAPNAAVAQHEAGLIARQRLARDPRGRAFAVS